jgi:aminomethyltransferase
MASVNQLPVDEPVRGRPRVVNPGIRMLPPGVERYNVAAGGSVVVKIFAGDTLRIVNREGGQVCEIVAMTADGREEPGILGQTSDGAADGLRMTLAQGGDNAEALIAALKAKGLPARFERSVRRFHPETPAFEETGFTVEQDGIVVVAAPGADMEVSDQNPPTPLELFVTRIDPEVAAEHTIPEPLAEPRYEFRIKPGTAHAYEVYEGEYIQILDVSGRECTDFQAIALKGLDKGLEYDLDPTATRTLTGTLYTKPGLVSKLFDNALQPSIEFIQDTVGRHDAFNYACTPRYYDEVGYPGHPNCTDNFNAELAPWGIKPRAGWRGMNYFYNTQIDDQNQIYLEEPWSRPGDYVLNRALQDMVCINSACPDGLDPANGWNPTDILIRVYRPENVFKKSIAFRAMPDSDPLTTKETGFHPRTSALTRSFTEYNGYWLPSSYTKHGAIEEYWACREGVIAMDLSALRKIDVTGPDATDLMQRTLTRNVRRLSDLEVSYSAMCYEHGGMVDDGTVFRLSETGYRWIGGSDFGGEWLRQKAAAWGMRCLIRNSTDQLHNISVQGPKSRDVLKQIVWTSPARPALEEIDWFRSTIGRIGDHNGVPIVVSRTGYTGELGYEVWCHPKHATAVWDAVFEAGEAHGITPLGLDALDMLRIESGLIFAGHEFDDQTDPYEAGIGFAVALKSTDEDFIGRAALERRKAHPQKKLVGLELEGGEPASHGDCVRIGRAQVGVVTSGVISPILHKNIALCRMDITHTEIGTEVEVGKLDGHMKRIPATVVPFPFYDPKKECPRA